MKTRRRRSEVALVPAFGAVLTPVRWVVLLGMLASLRLPFGREVDLQRGGVLGVIAIYAFAIAALPHLPEHRFTRTIQERLLLAADLAFSAAILLLSGGILSPYFGLLSLALIHATLLLGPRAGLCLAVGAAALVVIGEVLMPGGRG